VSSVATGTAKPEHRQFIEGQWVDASDGGRFDDLNPYTGEVVATAAAGTASDARRAIQAAADAFPAWSQTPPAERQRIFLAAADLLERRRDAVVSMLADETGCSFGFGMFQMGFVPGLLRQAAGTAYAPIGQILPSDTPGSFAMGIRRPVGVVGAIAPWNAALILSARSIAAPLVLGNTVVAKPSEESPFVGGLLWGEIFTEAGMPDGVLNILTHAPGQAGPIGDELVSNPAVRRINFTGSTATGRKLAEAAGRHLKRVVLELGGYNPLIVLADADLEYAVNASAFGAFLHQGQICMSARRIIVDRPIAEEFVGRLAAKTAGLKAGDPNEHDTVIGPLINERALQTVADRVADAVAKGARVLAGGERVGRCYQATLLADVPADAELARKETFGPVAAVEVVDGEDEAVRRANDTDYGLAAGIMTSDPDKGLALAERLQSGIVHVNDQPVADEPQMPFGGVKDSGWGRFGASAATDEFTELRWITVQSGTHPFPF
jgi:acyl-CoA reductase-like NAD-dependent aldehyde dehydrogenase